MSAKPTIVLVPGAWHSPTAMEALQFSLEAKSYKVIGVNLPSVGASPPLQSFDPDVEAIRAIVENAVVQNEEDVVMFMHSYGGVPSGEAVKGLDRRSREKDGRKGGVIHLFYCAAFAIDADQSLYEALGSTDPPWLIHSPNNDNIVTVSDPATTFYADVSNPDLLEKSITSLQHHSFASMKSKITWEPYRVIPSTYLICENDQALPPAVQKDMVKKMEEKGVQVVVQSLPTSHSPFLSAPDKVAQLVRWAAGEDGRV